MNLLRLTALLIYAYGAFSYGALLVLLIRRFGFADRTSRPAPARACYRIDFPSSAITLVSFAWFTVLLMLTLVELNPGVKQWPLLTVALFLVYLYPPLIAHSAYEEMRDGAAGQLRPGWKLSLWVIYLVSQASAV